MVVVVAVGSAVDLGEVGASFEAEDTDKVPDVAFEVAEGIHEEDIEVKDRASSFEADTVHSEDMVAWDAAVEGGGKHTGAEGVMDAHTVQRVPVHKDKHSAEGVLHTLPAAHWDS